jgi:hypothetical protein
MMAGLESRRMYLRTLNGRFRIMKTRKALFCFCLVFVLQVGFIRADERADYIRENYAKYEKRISVRDGVKLFTAI